MYEHMNDNLIIAYKYYASNMAIVNIYNLAVIGYFVV